MSKIKPLKIGTMNQNTFFKKNESATVINEDGTHKEISTVRVGEKCQTKLGVVTVLAACKNDSGLWKCVTHDEMFRTQLAKDIHIAHGDHRLAWMCYAHGIEQP